MIDLAVGRGCHFCGDRDARNYRLRRAATGLPPEELAAPLCARHLLLLRGGGAGGRLHKPTGVRWWLLTDATADAPGEAQAGGACPASPLLARAVTSDGQATAGDAATGVPLTERR